MIGPNQRLADVGETGQHFLVSALTERDEGVAAETSANCSANVSPRTDHVTCNKVTANLS